MRRSAAALAALAALLLGAAAAEARPSSSPQKWVSAFCGSVLTWEHTVKSSSAGFTTDMTKIQSGGFLDLKAAKKRFVRFFDGLVAATGSMTSGSKIGDSFQVLSKYDSPALDKAAANEPACKALGG